MDGLEKLTPCSPGDAGATEMPWTEVDSDKLLKRGCGEHEVERARERTSMAKWAFHRRNWHYLDHQDEGRAHMSHKV